MNSDPASREALAADRTPAQEAWATDRHVAWEAILRDQPREQSAGQLGVVMRAAGSVGADLNVRSLAEIVERTVLALHAHGLLRTERADNDLAAVWRDLEQRSGAARRQV